MEYHAANVYACTYMSLSTLLFFLRLVLVAWNGEVETITDVI